MPRQDQMDAPTCVEYCTGLGGLSAGLEASGFRHVLGIEHDAAAIRTLRNNDLQKRWNVHQADVRSVDLKDLLGDTEVDMFASGVPCQPFSQAGMAKGADDPRNLFPDAIDAVRVLRPKVALFENVRGLARPAFAQFLTYVLDQLRFPGLVRKPEETMLDHAARLREAIVRGWGDPSDRYHVECHQINVADYGRVGQKRHRLIFTLVRTDIAVEAPWPAATRSRAALVRSKSDGSYWSRHQLADGGLGVSESTSARLLCSDEADLESWLTLRDVTADLPELAPDADGAEIDGHYAWPGARTYRGHSGSALDEPSKTIKAGVHGVPGGEHIVILDSGDIRYMSVRECARVQALSDELVFDCPRSLAMRQIGNAVPPPIGEVFGSVLRKQLRESDERWRTETTSINKTSRPAVAAAA